MSIVHTTIMSKAGKITVNHNAETFSDAVGINPTEVLKRIGKDTPEEGQTVTEALEHILNSDITREEAIVLFVAEKNRQSQSDSLAALLERMQASQGDH